MEIPYEDYLEVKNSLLTTISSNSSDSDSCISSISSTIGEKNWLVNKHIKDIIYILINKTLNDLKLYITEKKTNLTELICNNDKNQSYEKVNLLTLTIAFGSSLEIIEYLLNEYPYKYFNFGGNNETPLFITIKEGYFDISNILIKYGGDINESKIIKNLQERNLLDISNLKYLLKKGLNIENIDIEKINDPLLLKIISKKFIFTNSFIFNLLNLYKNNEVVSNNSFKNIIQNEKQKIKFCISHYENVSNDSEKVMILFNYDGSEKSSMIYKIIKYDILNCAIELYIRDYKNKKNHVKNLNYVKNILNYNALSFKEIISKDHMDLLSMSNDISDTITDISKLIIESTIKNFLYQR